MKNTDTKDSNTPVNTVLREKNIGNLFFHNLQILQVGSYTLKINNLADKALPLCK
jgi:hypothetical protein